MKKKRAMEEEIRRKVRDEFSEVLMTMQAKLEEKDKEITRLRGEIRQLHLYR